MAAGIMHDYMACIDKLIICSHRDAKRIARQLCIYSGGVQLALAGGIGVLYSTSYRLLLYFILSQYQAL